MYRDTDAGGGVEGELAEVLAVYDIPARCDGVSAHCVLFRV
jgi:hypothetical protein